MSSTATAKERKFSPVNCQPYLIRLNFRLQHPPADTFHVKRDQKLLESCLDDPTTWQQMFERGSPAVQQRMQMFPV